MVGEIRKPLRRDLVRGTPGRKPGMAGAMQVIGRALTSSAGRACLELLLVLLLGVIFNADGAFFKEGTHRDTLRQASVYGILACGMTLVIITGGIDLSVGSVLAVSSVSFALFTMHMDWPWWLAILACLGLGSLLGSASGALVSHAKLQPSIATLALMTFARGFAKYITGGQKISTYVTQGDKVIIKELPQVFKVIDSRILGGDLAIVSVIFFVCFIIALGVSCPAQVGPGAVLHWGKRGSGPSLRRPRPHGEVHGVHLLRAHVRRCGHLSGGAGDAG